MPKTRPRPLSVREVVERTGIPRRSVVEAIIRGDLKAAKVGNTSRSAYSIAPADLERYLTKPGRQPRPRKRVRFRGHPTLSWIAVCYDCDEIQEFTTEKQRDAWVARHPHRGHNIQTSLEVLAENNGQAAS